LTTLTTGYFCYSQAIGYLRNDVYSVNCVYLFTLWV